MREFEFSQRFTDGWKRTIGILICIQFDDLRSLPPDARGQDFEGLNRCIRRQGFEMRTDLHLGFSLLWSAALAWASRHSASAIVAAMGPTDSAVF